MKINPAEFLILTFEEHTLLKKTAVLIDDIYERSTTNGELEKLTQTLDDAIYDLLNYTFLEVE